MVQEIYFDLGKSLRDAEAIKSSRVERKEFGLQAKRNAEKHKTLMENIDTQQKISEIKLGNMQKDVQKDVNTQIIKGLADLYVSNPSILDSQNSVVSALNMVDQSLLFPQSMNVAGGTQQFMDSVESSGGDSVQAVNMMRQEIQKELRGRSKRDIVGARSRVIETDPQGNVKEIVSPVPKEKNLKPNEQMIWRELYAEHVASAKALGEDPMGKEEHWKQFKKKELTDTQKATVKTAEVKLKRTMLASEEDFEANVSDFNMESKDYEVAYWDRPLLGKNKGKFVKIPKKHREVWTPSKIQELAENSNVSVYNLLVDLKSQGVDIIK